MKDKKGFPLYIILVTLPVFLWIAYVIGVTLVHTICDCLI